MLLFVLVNVSACSVVDNFMDTKRSNLDYKNNKTVKSLDFPPDLTAPEFDMAFVLPANGVVSASAMSNGSQSGGVNQYRRQINISPQSSTSIRVGAAGQSRWLDVNSSAESLWSKIRDFWRSVGIPIKSDEPRIGIMETEWVNSKYRGKILGESYDASLRDRFRIRLEKKTATTTRILLTHKRVKKVMRGSRSGWELRPVNHVIEAEMLNRLKVFLQQGVVGAERSSVSNRNATQTSSLVNIATYKDFPVMQIHDNYKRSWVLVGIMLDRMGLVTEKRNQAAGVYDVRYQGSDEDATKRGFLDRLLGRRKALLSEGEYYQVHIQNAGKFSIVRIADEGGKPLSKKLSQLVLTRLKQEFDR